MKTTTKSHGDSIVLEVRRLKEENVAEHGFNARAIGAAIRRHQQEHSERVVSRERPNTDQQDNRLPTPSRNDPLDYNLQPCCGVTLADPGSKEFLILGL